MPPSRGCLINPKLIPPNLGMSRIRGLCTHLGCQKSTAVTPELQEKCISGKQKGEFVPFTKGLGHKSQWIALGIRTLDSSVWRPQSSWEMLD